MTHRRSSVSKLALPLALLLAGAAFAIPGSRACAADWSNMGGDAGRNALTAERGPDAAHLAWSGGRSSLIAWHACRRTWRRRHRREHRSNTRGSES